MTEPAHFFKAALRDYSQVGGLFPSSPFAAKAVSKHVSRTASVVVEYGAGEGIITREILRRLGEYATLVSIEINPRFIPSLNRISDKRLKVIQGDVLEMSYRMSKISEKCTDVVVSGIPFAFIHLPNREMIIENTRLTLKEDGIFVVYQNSPRIGKDLRQYFSEVRVAFEPRNIFPYFIFIAKP